MFSHCPSELPTLNTMALFEELKIETIKWPANSLDLNPIENIWSPLKYRIGLHFPTTRKTVIEAIQNIWS
jgi:hypothetical protein